MPAPWLMVPSKKKNNEKLAYSGSGNRAFNGEFDLVLAAAFSDVVPLMKEL